MAQPLLFRLLAMIQQTDSMDVILDKPSGLSRRSKILIGAAVVLILSLIPLWPALQRWSQADQSVDLARLRIATVTRGDLERDVAAEGRIVAANHPRLYSPAEGTVALRVRAGQTVTKGQALATIESPELESQLAQERSRLQSLESELGRARISAKQQNVGNDQTAELRRVRLEAARRELQRAEKLRSEGLLNEVEHERSKDAVRLAEVELEQSRQGSRLQREALDFEVTDRSRQVERQRLVVAELERRVRELAVAAPFDGQVATVDVDDRQAVAANAPLLTVVDLSTYEVEIRIPEAYADEIGSGTRVEIDYGGRKLPGTLTAVSPEVR
ncbi:MAG TPA: HlyD family efflux transporter periplasmic adaptor subunit, partial [Thermoanaerobaculia bacterium]